MLEWYLPDRGVGAERGSAQRIHRDVARPAAEARRRAADLGDARLPFAQPDLARRASRHLAGRHHRLPGCRAGAGRLRSGVAAAGCADRRPGAARTGAADSLHQVRGARPTTSFDPAGFAELYAIMSAQRNTRLLGTFARLNRRDGKPQYLRHQPRIWTYLTRSLAHPALVGPSRLVRGPRAAAASLDLPVVSHPRPNLTLSPRQARSASCSKRESDDGDGTTAQG